MNNFSAVVFGLVEGLTEFLPVSSTFHLIWFAKFLAVPESDFLKVFEVVIQAGAILAVIFLYVKAVLENKTVLRLVFFSFLPTMAVGFILYKVIKDVFFTSDFLQILVFVLVGLAFIVLEKHWKNKKMDKTITTINVKEAVYVGLMQSAAVIPGVSRSGIVMLSLMHLGISREEAARYSFYLAVPTVLSASVFDLWKNKTVLMENSLNITELAIGLLVSFIVAMVVIRWFINFLQKHSLAFFGYYRVAVGLVLAGFLWLK